MKIAIIGTGYVGLVSGACFAEIGIDVVCIDIDKSKIENLKRGEISIYEPKLKELVKRNLSMNRLSFENSITPIINEVDVVFIAVGTPPTEDGDADLSNVFSVAKTIAENISKPILIVTKSTVPIGTSHKIKDLVKDIIKKRGLNIEFEIASNPEFLKEGNAVDDFMSPDRVIVGIESERAKELMSRIYKPFLLNNFRIIFMDIKSSEMTKYASNCMLATRISFMNDIANLCELIGADVNMVRKGMANDPRIGKYFLYPGCGYGGSCFPKDIKALIKAGEKEKYEMSILKSVHNVNENQKNILFKKLKNHFNGKITDKTIAIWGLSFKPETDDIREAPSLNLIRDIIKNGANARVYDPVSMPYVKKLFNSSQIYYAKDIYDAANNADAIVLVTEWKEFRIPNWSIIKKITNSHYILDGRNIYEKEELINMGFDYEGIGTKFK